MDDLMVMAVICQEYSWTYEEYLDQPTFLLDLIRQKMAKDAKRQEMELRKMKRV